MAVAALGLLVFCFLLVGFFLFGGLFLFVCLIGIFLWGVSWDPN